LKAAVLAAVFGALFSQVAMRVEPLASVAGTFPPPSIHRIVGVFTALLSVIVLLCGRDLARRIKRPIWVGILGTGAFFLVVIIVLPGGRGGSHSHYPSIEFMLSALEIGICFGPAALFGHIAGT
jgi:hypothetical protein